MTDQRTERRAPLVEATPLQEVPSSASVDTLEPHLVRALVKRLMGTADSVSLSDVEIARAKTVQNEVIVVRRARDRTVFYLRQVPPEMKSMQDRMKAAAALAATVPTLDSDDAVDEVAAQILWLLSNGKEGKPVK